MYKIKSDNGGPDYEDLTVHRDSSHVPNVDTPAQARAIAQVIADSENKDCEYAWSPIRWSEDGMNGVQIIRGYTWDWNRTKKTGFGFPVHYRIVEVV